MFAQYGDDSVADDYNYGYDYAYEYNDYEYDDGSEPSMGEYAYDEQQWWNPADWFDDTGAWDYNNDWHGYEWYEDEYDNGVGGNNGYESGADYGTLDYDDDDTWDDFDWFGDFDYDADM